MGWGDNRKSPKMKRRHRLRKHKERMKRRAGRGGQEQQK